jgi:RNase adaptor protein for sRNA GlmZ degradation
MMPHGPDVPVVDYHLHSIVTSFGYRHGAPPPATIVIDVRELLRNPHADPALRHLTGLDPEVRDHVVTTAGASELADDTAALVLRLLPLAGDPAFQRVDVALGCAGGRHRSVALAEEIAARLEVAGRGVLVEHRDIDKAVLPPACI